MSENFVHRMFFRMIRMVFLYNMARPIVLLNDTDRRIRKANDYRFRSSTLLHTYGSFRLLLAKLYIQIAFRI